MVKIAFETLWKIVKIVTVIQIFNAAMDYFMWAAYGYLVPSWTIATITVGYIVLIFAVKRAQEKERSLIIPSQKPQFNSRQKMRSPDFLFLSYFLVSAVATYLHIHNQHKPCILVGKITSATSQQTPKNKPTTKQNLRSNPSCGT